MNRRHYFNGSTTMSYILEALKKSEKRRREEAGSSQLYQYHPREPVAEAERMGFRRWVILFAVVLAIIFFLGYYYSAHIKTAVSEMWRSDTQAKEKTAATSSQGSIRIKPLSVLKSKSRGEAPTSAYQEDIGETLLQPAPLVADKELKRAPAISSERLHPSVPSLKDLEPDFRRSVPPLRLAGHVYSEDPKLRMILINNRVIREMDIVEKDFVVEEITPDGVIMRLGEIRFRLPSD